MRASLSTQLNRVDMEFKTLSMRLNIKVGLLGVTLTRLR